MNFPLSPEDKVSYQSLIESCGVEILLDVEEDNWQGDSYLILEHLDTLHLGFLTFGWGSCSGCDAFQACESDKEFEELRDALWNGIRWFDTKDELVAWIKKHDWKGDFGDEYTKREFVKQALKYFGEDSEA